MRQYKGLTSQMQELQEQMKSMNDSGEFQEVESNYSGRLSYVPSQPAGIPSSRSMLSCDERLPLDTWNTSGLQDHHIAGIPRGRDVNTAPDVPGQLVLVLRPFSVKSPRRLEKRRFHTATQKTNVN